MKIAYLDCASGISGDMTLGALIDAGVDMPKIQEGIDSLGLPSCRLVADQVKRKGFRATLVTVQHEPEHAHRHLHHIDAMIDGSRLSDRQKDLARRIFLRLGQAEAKVHGTTVEKVHFHEVGAVDSIADIVGAAIGWDLLGAQRIVSSPVPTGTGFVQIAHGRCSIPAPATGELLKGVPLAGSTVEAELTTPTGAAILATLVEQFGPPPAMTVQQIGYGAGQRDLDQQPNLLRLMVGQVDEPAAEQQIWVVETNLDDATGEQIGYCTTRLFEAGALDVYTTPIQMKKNRPGVMVTVLCEAADLQQLEQILIRDTTTLGVRRWPVARTTLRRQSHEVETPWGKAHGMIARRGEGFVTFSPEYESCRVLAEQHSLPLAEIYQAARAAFDPSTVSDDTGELGGRSSG